MLLILMPPAAAAGAGIEASEALAAARLRQRAAPALRHPLGQAAGMGLRPACAFPPVGAVSQCSPVPPKQNKNQHRMPPVLTSFSPLHP